MVDPIFTYYITNVINRNFEKHVMIGNTCINTDKRTPVTYASSDKMKIAIIGFAIDTNTGDSDSVAECLINKCKSIEDVIAAEYSLGGKYIIFTEVEDRKYILGDATCSIPICYYINNNEFTCASDSFIIAREKNLVEDEGMLRIRYSGDLSQAMPFDITTYKEIKQLLPNHFLDLETGVIKRYEYFKQSIRMITPDEAAKFVIPLAVSLVKGFKKHFDLIVPITSGKDSRVVLALTREVDNSVSTYTLKHKKHSDLADDLVIAKQITDYLDVSHVQYSDIDIPAEFIEYFDKIFKKERYSQKTLQIACTVYHYFNSKAIINGDIMGQIGKCSLHRDIPVFLSSPGYYRCKMHNYSSEAKTLTNKWMKEIEKSNEHMLTFDLFSIENRMGRWSAQNLSIYNYLGQPNINIFNSRKIIATFCSVDRKKRMNSEIHKAILKQIDNRYLDIPFGKESGIAALAKKNSLLYYFASFYKYYYEKAYFMKKKDGNID